MKDRFKMIIGFNSLLVVVFLIVMVVCCLWTLSFEPFIILKNNISSGGMTLWHSVLAFEAFILIVSLLN